jgi:hypothetical protein
MKSLVEETIPPARRHREVALQRVIIHRVLCSQIQATGPQSSGGRIMRSDDTTTLGGNPMALHHGNKRIMEKSLHCEEFDSIYWTCRSLIMVYGWEYRG